MIVRLLLAAPLIVHGLAHLGGFLGLWMSSSAGFATSPWILSSKLTSQSLLGRVFGLLWLLVVVGFVVAGLGLVFAQPWWPSLAIAAAATSLVIIVLCWTTVPPGARIGAAFDLLVLVVLLLPTREWILDLVG
jgi:hypothetical protein